MKSNTGITSQAQHIIDKLSYDDLHSFFFKYLRTDPKANILFLARFSDHINLQESERYEWLFYKSIRTLRGSSTYLGISKQKFLAKIYEELSQQAADALAINHFIKTFYILKYGLVFLRLLSQKEKTLNKALTTMKQRYMSLLFKLYNTDLPRDLIAQFTSFVEDEIEHEPFQIVDDIHLYLRLKTRLEYEQNGWSSVKEYIKYNWSMDSLKSSEELSAFYYILLTEPWTELALRDISELTIPREVLKRVLLKMNQSSQNYPIDKIWNELNLDSTFEHQKFNGLKRTLNMLNEENHSKPLPGQ